MEGKQGTTFMQFCSIVNNFTKTSSQMLESIYQAILLFHKMAASDTGGRKEKEEDIMEQIRVLRDSTATVLIEFKRNFSNASTLPSTQQIVLNFSTSLIKLIVAFTNSAKKLEPGEEIGNLYRDILNTAKQTISSINFSLKGSYVSEDHINILVKNVKDVKAAATDLEGKVRTRDKANYFTSARAFVSAVNDLIATSSEMGILEVNLEAKLKASVVGIMSAGKTALGSTWDSVTAMVAMHEGKDELFLIVKELLTKCYLSRKASALNLERAGDIHMSLPSRTLSPLAGSPMGMKKSSSASQHASPNNSDLNTRNYAAQAKLPPTQSVPTSPPQSPPLTSRTSPNPGIPKSMLALFSSTDPRAQTGPPENLKSSLSASVTPRSRNSPPNLNGTPSSSSSNAPLPHNGSPAPSLRGVPSSSSHYTSPSPSSSSSNAPLPHNGSPAPSLRGVPSSSLTSPPVHNGTPSLNRNPSLNPTTNNIPFLSLNGPPLKSTPSSSLNNAPSLPVPLTGVPSLNKIPPLHSAKDTLGRRSSAGVLERTSSLYIVDDVMAWDDESPDHKSVQIDLSASQSERLDRPRSLSVESGMARRLGSTQTIMPPTGHSDLMRTDSTTSSILSSSQDGVERGNSMHSDTSRGSQGVFTEVDLRGSWDLKQAELNVAKKSKIKLALRKERKESKESKEQKEYRETKDRETQDKEFYKDSKDSKVKREDSKRSPKVSDDRVIDADVPLEEIVQRVTNAFVDQYSHFREEYHAQSEYDRARSVSLVATSLQNKFPEISTNIPPPPPPPPKKTWKKKLIPSCFKPTRMKSVQLPPEKMGWD